MKDADSMQRTKPRNFWPRVGGVSDLYNPANGGGAGGGGDEAHVAIV